MILMRSVKPLTRAITPPMMVAAMRIKSCAIAVIASQAALAVNTLEGICVRGTVLSSA